MKSKVYNIFLLFIFGGCLIVAGCGDSDGGSSMDETDQIPREGEAYDPGTTDEDRQNVNSTLNKAQEALRNQQGVEGEVVDFKELKQLLPEEVKGWKRTDHTGQKMSYAGLQLSQAEASYKKGDKNINVSITDALGSGQAITGLAMWSQMEMEREDDQGYARTGTFEGAKSFEEYKKNNNSSSLSLMWKERYIVQLHGNKVEMSEVKEFARKLPLQKLK